MRAKISDYVLYFLYNILKIISLHLPKSLVKKFLLVLVKLAYKFNKKHNKIAKANLDLVYENSISKDRKEEIIYNSYKSLAFNMYEFIENQSVEKEVILSKANVINDEVILKAKNEKRKIIYITAHYGGWEIALPYVALKYGKLAVVNRKMNNPLINDMYIKARDRNNITMIDKKSAAKGMMLAFKNELDLALVIDQHIRTGVELEFLGKKDIMTDSTSRMALKYDAVIIPVFSIMNDFRDYTIQIGEAIDVLELELKSDDEIKELTKIQAEVIEKQIHEKPELWFWQHKRWKQFYREIY